MTADASTRPHIPSTEVPLLIDWPCRDCPNRLRVASRIKNDSLAVMDGTLELDGLWVPDKGAELMKRKVIIVQLGRKIADLYAKDCPGASNDEEFERIYKAYNAKRMQCNSSDSVVLERIGHALTPGRGNYGHGLNLQREQVYLEPDITRQAAIAAEIKDQIYKRKWERY